MPWQIPVLLHIIIGNLVAPVLNKKISAPKSRTRKLVWQYIFAAALAISLALINRANLLDERVLIVLVIGTFNGFACYCYWRAIDINLSKTSIATQWDDLITIGLGYLILNEAKLLSPILAVGVILSIGTALYFTLSKGKNIVPEKIASGKMLVVWVTLYSIIWGVAVFSMRYFALDGMSLWAYIAAWYSGSLVGAIVVFVVAGKKEAGVAMNFKQIITIVPVTIVIWASMAATYWAKCLAPITVVQPIYQVSEMVLPTLIGLWIFREAKELRPIDKFIFALGIAGGLIIVLSYR